MRISELLVLSSCAVLAYCHPHRGAPHNYTSNHHCLTKSDASDLVNNFLNNVAANYDATIANKLVTDDIVETSQSVLALGGVTGAALQGPSSVGKNQTLSAEANKPFTLAAELIAIEAVGCNTIAFRWWGTPANKTPVRAISIFHTVKSEQYGWQINEIFGEFNSLTWGQDLGANVTLPPLGPSPSKN